MDRTLRAALVAGVSVAATIGVVGPFLGFPTVPTVLLGIGLGILAALLLWGAGRRAESFHPTDPAAHLADHRDTSVDEDAPVDAGHERTQGDPATRNAADDPPDDMTTGA